MAGAALGFLILHPYAMAVHGLYGRYRTINGHADFLHQLSTEIAYSFKPDMLPMGLPFALVGGLTGMVVAFWFEAKRHQFEIEKRLCSVETLKQLMVTLSHHLLNAVQGIGGFSAYLIRKEQDEDIRRRLEMIRTEAIRIEAVVKSLQSVESVVSERYIRNGGATMIDINKELKDRLEDLKRKPA